MFINPYLHVGNNPLNWIDPYGLVNVRKVITGIGLQFAGYGYAVLGMYIQFICLL
jgi:hypothetical protein